MVVNPSKPLIFTSKGTIKRHPSLSAYRNEIENAYKALEASDQQEIKPPSVWDRSGVQQFISEVVNTTLGVKANSDDDIFRIGADRFVMSLFD